jgi:phosphate transport system permease protein
LPVCSPFRIVESVETTVPKLSLLASKRARRRGFSTEGIIKGFFSSNALVAVVVLALITVFLFREGFGFFGQNLDNLRLYRRAGLEYVDIMRVQADNHAALGRWLHQISLLETEPTAREQFDQFADKFSESGTELSALVSDAGDHAVALRDAIIVREASAGVEIDRGQSEVDPDSAEVAAPIDEEASLAALRANGAKFETIVASIEQNVRQLLDAAPQLSQPKAQKSFSKWQARATEFLNHLPGTVERLRTWDRTVPVPWYRAIGAFLFGKDWVTASFWQNWYGVIPLLAGSILVSMVALLIAVPFGVSAAIYVSEVAARGEKSLIKPYIEFISAIPSVVLGFFGIAVVGEAVRTLSHASFMSWVPFFPISERLNAFTAGCLLALMAVPTIFTLAEDALRNVPRGFKEASYALGANRLQTIVRVLVPASLSGIISAILLGLGRVIGETMVVLLCAGNRIQIPDFTEGLGAFFQPVHTMTGIIAQEMGEVVRGSIHYRALFVVGLVLFFITLAINYLAQKLVTRYRMSIG